MPDETIDFSDIPEITDQQWTGAVSGLSVRPEMKHISIRLSAVDLIIANKLAAAKGLPFQTYIRSLLHKSLMKENFKIARKPVRHEMWGGPFGLPTTSAAMQNR